LLPKKGAAISFLIDYECRCTGNRRLYHLAPEPRWAGTERRRAVASAGLWPEDRRQRGGDRISKPPGGRKKRRAGV